jgi:hypothetical protein
VQPGGDAAAQPHLALPAAAGSDGRGAGAARGAASRQVGVRGDPAQALVDGGLDGAVGLRGCTSRVGRGCRPSTHSLRC